MIFFLGAGASIPAGISGVEGMVTKFLERLQNENNNYYGLALDLFNILTHWRKKNGKDIVDIELMLETIEKLENKDSDVMSLFYNKKNSILQKFEKLHANTDVKLSTILKQFVKAETGKTDLQIDYLTGLLRFMRTYRSLHIFSTNYDVCIERFCELNHKSYFDGFFDRRWDITKLNIVNDLYLYKLHGSVTWSRDAKGRYTRNEIAIADTTKPQINIVSGEKEVPLISYPGRKLEYFEPVFDLLEELRKHLNNTDLKYVFVIGYSFRDDHIRRLFQYAGEKNREFVLFIISPSAHQIYLDNLKNYKDIDFERIFSDKSNENVNSTRTSSLRDRVICLPYKIENVLDSLEDNYLEEIKQGLEKERVENEKDENQVVRTYDYLRHFVACEYFDKVERILDERMGGLDNLMKSDYHLYELGWQMILKALLSNLFLYNERDKWSQRFKKYLAILANGIEVKLYDQTKFYLLFKYSEQQPSKPVSDIYSLFKLLVKIYNNHRIFLNKHASEKMKITKLMIPEIELYFSLWQKNTITFSDYISTRKGKVKYANNVEVVKHYAEGKITDQNQFISAVKQIEKTELLRLID
jgi:hypothetical protein